MLPMKKRNDEISKQNGKMIFRSAKWVVMDGIENDHCKLCSKSFCHRQTF